MALKSLEVKLDQKETYDINILVSRAIYRMDGNTIPNCKDRKLYRKLS